MSDWKKHHANEAEKSLTRPVLQDVRREFMRNIGIKDEGLPAYGMTKVMAYVAAVVRAETLGFDPDLLLSNDEADEALLKVAQMAAESGKPVWVIATGEERA